MKTTILFLRHEENIGNLLKANGIKSAQATGKKLRTQGVKISIIISSPQWRCLNTIHNLLVGYGEMIPIASIDYRFGDIKIDDAVDPKLIANILETSTKLGVDKEEIYFNNEPIKADLIRRGNEGAKAIYEIVSKNLGKTILICSHGGSRMEPTICSLLGSDISNPPFIFNRGAIAKILFDGSNLESVEFLGKL